MTKIVLGQRARDRITGYVGVVVGRTEWLNGCVRFGIQSELLKYGVPTETQWFDEAASAPARGGPMPAPSRLADPGR